MSRLTFGLIVALIFSSSTATISTFGWFRSTQQLHQLELALSAQVAQARRRSTTVEINDAPIAVPIIETPTSTPSPTHTATIPSTSTKPPTMTPSSTATASPTNTPSPTSTPSPQPTNTSAPTETPTPNPTATDIVEERQSESFGTVTAQQDAALFVLPTAQQGRTRFYLPAGETAEVLGRSADSFWLHLRLADAGEGWAASTYLRVHDFKISELPLSDYVGEYNEQITALYNDTPSSVTATPPSWPTPTPTRFHSHAPIKPATPTPYPTAQPVSTVSDASVSVVYAWWMVDERTVQTNQNGTWRFDVEVRVPTGAQHQFELSNLVNVRASGRNVEGDDLFVLTVGGIKCGAQFMSELVVRRNGQRLQSINEFSLSEGNIAINAPC